MKKVEKCRSCGASVVWLETQAGHWMPVEASGVRDFDRIYNPKVHESHFASCPQAVEWRKKHVKGKG